MSLEPVFFLYNMQRLALVLSLLFIFLVKLGLDYFRLFESFSGVVVVLFAELKVFLLQTYKVFFFYSRLRRAFLRTFIQVSWVFVGRTIHGALLGRLIFLFF